MDKVIHRQIWEQHKGEIPKGYLIHHLNGSKLDNRLENLAAIPRIPPHIGWITAPYRERIRNLERELKFLKENK